MEGDLNLTTSKAMDQDAIIVICHILAKPHKGTETISDCLFHIMMWSAMEEK